MSKTFSMTASTIFTTIAIFSIVVRVSLLFMLVAVVMIIGLP